MIYMTQNRHLACFVRAFGAEKRRAIAKWVMKSQKQVMRGISGISYPFLSSRNVVPEVFLLRRGAVVNCRRANGKYSGKLYVK
jgi:hypothetical protein